MQYLALSARHFLEYISQYQFGSDSELYVIHLPFSNILNTLMNLFSGHGEKHSV